MKRLSLISLATVAGILLIAAQVFAYNVLYDNSGSPYDIASVVDYSITGADMDGMKVTAYFSNNTFETATWSDIPGGSSTDGQAKGFLGRGWSLFENGDTFTNKWSFDLNNRSEFQITKLVIDATAGNTVFDTGLPNDTPGSAGGKAFSVSNSSGLNLNALTATYSNQVSLNGLVYGDLYGKLSIEFVDNFFDRNDTLKFIADTDTVNPTPEPGTIILLGAGIAGLVAFRKKFRK